MKLLECNRVSGAHAMGRGRGEMGWIWGAVLESMVRGRGVGGSAMRQWWSAKEGVCGG